MIYELNSICIERMNFQKTWYEYFFLIYKYN